MSSSLRRRARHAEQLVEVSHRSAVLQPAAELVADDLDGGHRLGVVHAGRAEHADRTAAARRRRRSARRPPSTPTAARRRARRRSPPTCPAATRSPSKRDDDELLLQRAQHVADDLDGVERRRHRRGAADVDVLVASSRVAHGREGRRRDRRSTTLVPGRRQVIDGPSDRPVSWAARWAEAAASWASVTSASSVDRARSRRCRCRARRPPWPASTTAATICTLRTATAPGPWADDDGGVVGQVGQQVGRAGGASPRGGRGRCGRSRRPGPCDVVEAPRRAQVVDEEPVPLVGRDAAGRRVRLDEVPLLLEHGHLVAHRRRRDAHAGRVGDVGRPTGSAVAMYSCTTALRIAVFRSSSIWHSTLPSASPAWSDRHDGNRDGHQGRSRCRTPAPTAGRCGRRSRR